MYRIALVELVVCWVLWFYPFVRAQRRPRRKSAATVAWAKWGILLQMLSYLLAGIFRARPPVAPERMVGSMILGPVAVISAWAAVEHLGKQWRIQAGVYADHELVQSGPYAIVRHPIYASMLALFLNFALLLTRWPHLLMALAVFFAGTEIRVRAEDEVLHMRFGSDFETYRRRVPGYLPFVR